MDLNISNLAHNGDYWDNIVHSAMQLGTHRSKSFLQKLIFSGRVRAYSDNWEDYITEEQGFDMNAIYQKYYERICDTIDVFDSKHGDNWDIVISYQSSYLVINFVTIYRDITIINNLQKTHDIKDLVVRVGWSFNSSGELYLDRVMGSRLSMTTKELDCNYLHSHLSARGCGFPISHNYFDLGTFCIGDGTDVRNVEDDITLDYEKDKLELYLYTIDSLVSYESLEGGPHIKMSEIVEKKKKSYNENDESGYRLINDIIQNAGIALNVDFYISEGRYKIKENINFVNFIKRILHRNTSSDTWGRFLVQYHRSTNTYFPYKEAIQGNRNYNITSSLAERYFFYRGSIKTFRVIKINTLQNKPLELEDFTIHPNLIKYVIKQFESQLYRKAVRLSRIARENSLSNT